MSLGDDNMNETDLQRMAHMLRHRLRNIASGIRGALSVIEDEAGVCLPPGLREYFPLMLRECDSLQDVASRISWLFDAQPAESAPASADEIVLRAANAAAARFPAVQIDYRGSCSELVHGWMQTALMELLVNGCEAAPQGRVNIRYKQSGQLVVWVVTDSGPGLDPEADEDPFAPFFTMRPRHLGVGLPIARRLSRMLGGDCSRAEIPFGDAKWAVSLSCPVETEASG